MNHIKKIIILILILGDYSIMWAQAFTEIPNTSFIAVVESSVAFSDIDGDLDQDVIVAGYDLDLNIPITKLYQNDGNGNYIELSGSSIEGISAGAIEFADIDSDGDEDLFLAGRSISGMGVCKLYINDGQGMFLESETSNFEGVVFSAIKVFDSDNDSDLDIIVAGVGNSPDIRTDLYENDGSGNFLNSGQDVFEGLYDSSIGIADIDGDDDNDIVITGRNTGVFSSMTKEYKNDGQGNFFALDSTALESIFAGSVDFGDIDNDSDQDVLIVGGNVPSARKLAQLYKNDGEGNLSLVEGTGLEGATFGSSRFVDIDNDDDLDIFISGFGDSSRIFKLYVNNGNGNYTPSSEIFTGFSHSSIDFADIDGDNDIDIIISGKTSPDMASTLLYRNDILSSENNFSIDAENIVVFPNPFKSGQALFIRNNDFSTGRFSIQIYNSIGQQVFTETKATVTSEHILQLDSLEPGQYVVVIRNENGYKLSKRLIVLR